MSEVDRWPVGGREQIRHCQQLRSRLDALFALVYAHLSFPGAPRFRHCAHIAFNLFLANAHYFLIPPVRVPDMADDSKFYLVAVHGGAGFHARSQTAEAEIKHALRLCAPFLSVLLPTRHMQSYGPERARWL